MRGLVPFSREEGGKKEGGGRGGDGICGILHRILSGTMLYMERC